MRPVADNNAEPMACGRAPSSGRLGAAAASLTGAVGVVIDGGPLVAAASTVVDVTGTEPIILREGPIGGAAIAVAVR